MEKILTSGKSFIDEYGRERIFNGVNICDKGCFAGVDRVYNTKWDEEMLKKLKANGVNIVRLGITWDAVEPVPGEYDEDYLNAVGGFLDKCLEYGIYAYIDMHQDLYSGFGCGVGDGAPAWACMTDGAKRHKTRIVWAEGYFWGKAVHRAFDNFWDNKLCGKKGLQDYYADMWQHIADKFKDHPALFGFDMMNEPFPGTEGGKVFRTVVKNLIKVTLTDKRIDKIRLVKDAFCKDRRIGILEMYTGDVLRKITSAADSIIYDFDTKKYAPFLEKVSTSIREVTDDGILFIDNSYYSNLGIPFSAPAIKVNGKRDPKQCFAPHAYDLFVDTPLYKYANNSRVGAIFAEHKNAQERLDVPVIVGEWGGNSTGTDWLPHIEFLLDLFDANKWSFTYWEHSAYVNNQPLYEVLKRPYPKAVTGVIESFKHDRQAARFTLSYTQDKAFSVPTEIFLPHEPKAIECDGEYTLEKIEGTEGYNLLINTQAGSHKVCVAL